MSTYMLFNKVFSKYNLTARMVEPTDVKAMAEAINEKTRFVFVETIGNPKLDVPNIRAIAQIAHQEGIPLIVDNTLATPYLCRPFDLGADVVIHSTTKYLSGHGAAVGGVVIDGGKFDWSQERFPGFQTLYRPQRSSGPSGQNLAGTSYQLRHDPVPFSFLSDHAGTGYPGPAYWNASMKNTSLLAGYLRRRPEVTWVNYPGLQRTSFPPSSSETISRQRVRGHDHLRP